MLGPVDGRTAATLRNCVRPEGTGVERFESSPPLCTTKRGGDRMRDDARLSRESLAYKRPCAIVPPVIGRDAFLGLRRSMGRRPWEYRAASLPGRFPR